MALVQPKKPVGGAFGIFLSEKRPDFIKACQGQTASAVSKMAGEEWKKLSDAEKEPFQKKYEEAKAQFDKDMASFLENGGTKTKGLTALRNEKKKGDTKAKKDTDAPKRPAGGGYGRFLAVKREEIKSSLPADHKITDVAKKASELWKAMPEAEKQTYDVMFQEAQAVYKKEMEAYIANKAEEPASEPATEDVAAKTSKKRESDQTSSEKPAKRERRTATPKSKAGQQLGVELNEETLEKARLAGYEVQLRNLAMRPEVVASGKPAEELLQALETSAGLVNPAKHALLGA